MAVPERFAHPARLDDVHIYNAYLSEMWILVILLVVQFFSVSWITSQRTRGNGTLQRLLLAVVALLLDFLLLFCIFRIAALAMFKRTAKGYDCDDDYDYGYDYSYNYHYDYNDDYCGGKRRRKIAQALYGFSLPFLLLEYVRMLRRCLNSADPENKIPHWGILKISMNLSLSPILLAPWFFLLAGLKWKANPAVAESMTSVGLGLLVFGFVCTVIQSLGVWGKGDNRGRLISRFLQILLPIFAIRLIWLFMDVVGEPTRRGKDVEQYWSDKWELTAALEVFMDLLAVVLLVAARAMLGADLDKKKEEVPQV